MNEPVHIFVGRESGSESFPTPMFGEPVAAPHRVFLWRPRNTADQGWKWLRSVWRQRMVYDFADAGGPISYGWFYTAERPK